MGLPLIGFAFLTNPVPDPSFPWATLPDTFRVSYTQPRIEHWLVTYTVGIWLWILGFPALFFAGYQRLTDHSRFDRRVWLGSGFTVMMMQVSER